MPEYEVSLQEALVALLSDPEKFAEILVDTADAQTNLKSLEPIEEMAKGPAKQFIVRGLTGLQEKTKNVTWPAERG